MQPPHPLRQGRRCGASAGNSSLLSCSIIRASLTVVLLSGSVITCSFVVSSSFLRLSLWSSREANSRKLFQPGARFRILIPLVGTSMMERHEPAFPGCEYDCEFVPSGPMTSGPHGNWPCCHGQPGTLIARAVPVLILHLPLHRAVCHPVIRNRPGLVRVP